MWNAVAGENKLQRASLVQCSKLQIVTFTLRMEMPWHAMRERSAWCVYVTLARQPHQEWLISTGAFLSERMDVWLEDRPPHIRRTRSLKPTKLVVVCAFIIHRSSYIYSSPCLLLLVLRAHADRYVFRVDGVQRHSSLEGVCVNLFRGEEELSESCFGIVTETERVKCEAEKWHGVVRQPHLNGSGGKSVS